MEGLCIVFIFSLEVKIMMFSWKCLPIGFFIFIFLPIFHFTCLRICRGLMIFHSIDFCESRCSCAVASLILLTIVILRCELTCDLCFIFVAAFMSVLHMYESFGWWRRSDYLKVHFAESWNEMHHLLIMEVRIFLIFSV